MTVVVGVSPTSGSPNAIRWAADEAKLRDDRLIAVMAWKPPRPPAAPGGRPQPVLAATAGMDPQREAMESLTTYVDDALGPAHAVECVVVKGNAANALLSVAAEAQLLVLGEPGRGRMTSIQAGLVAPRLVLRAPCPVVVLPATVAAPRPH
ncbi:MAG: universal stress protein [Actinobacteria bacterium]|nr:universal stress protein [Actinomycetota bacterium]